MDAEDNNNGRIFTTNGARNKKKVNFNIVDTDIPEETDTREKKEPEEQTYNIRTRGSKGLTGSPWIEYMPSKPRIPKLRKRTAKPRWDRTKLNAAPVLGVSPVDDYLIQETGIRPADLDNPPYSKDIDENIRLSVICLNIIAILAPDPQVQYYLPIPDQVTLRFSWTKKGHSQSASFPVNNFLRKPAHSDPKAIPHVSIRFFHALARGCIPWRLLEIAGIGLHGYLPTLDQIEPDKKQPGARGSKKKGVIDMVEEEDGEGVVAETERKRSKRYKLVELEGELLSHVKPGEYKQLTGEYDKFVQLVREYKLNMHPEDERRMNYPNYMELEKHALVSNTANFKKNEHGTLWFPLRDYDGVIYLATAKAKTTFMVNTEPEDCTIERRYKEVWNRLGFAKSSEGGHPPRHVNVGFPGPLRKWPFWIRILPAAEERFGGKVKAEGVFAECITGTNTSSGKYKIKLGLYDDDGNIISVLRDKNLPGVELRIDTKGYVFLSENPFQLYQTWIHIECLSEYITKGAPRQLPDMENFHKPLTANVEIDEEEKADTGKNTKKQEPKAPKKQVAKLPKSAAERTDDQKYFNDIYEDLYKARHALAGALNQPSAGISNVAAIEANAIIQKQRLGENDYNDNIWNPLVVSINAAKVVATTGGRTGAGVKSQGSIMGSASEIAKYRFKWDNKDTYIIDKPMIVEGKPPEEKDDENLDNAADDETAHEQSEIENKVDGEEESPDLKVNGGFHTFYIAEWLHLSAFSWGGLKLAQPDRKPKDIPTIECRTSQICWNLIFGTSETNSVMTRFEGAWQDLFEDEVEAFRDSPGGKKDIMGWLIIERDPPGVQYIEENRNHFDGVMYKPKGPYGGDPRYMLSQSEYPWICYCLRYTIVIQGNSRILSRKNPSFTTHFYPFTRFFFHSAENSLDTRLFQCMKKQALSAQEINEFTTNNMQPHDKSPKLFWKPLFPGEQYKPNEAYVGAHPSKAYALANKQPVLQSSGPKIQSGAASTPISNNFFMNNPSSQNNRPVIPSKSLVTNNVSMQSLFGNSSMGGIGGNRGGAMGGLGGNLGGNLTGKSRGGMDEERTISGTQRLQVQDNPTPFIMRRNTMDPQNLPYFANLGNPSFGQRDNAQLGLLNFSGNPNPILGQFQTYQVQIPLPTVIPQQVDDQPTDEKQKKPGKKVPQRDPEQMVMGGVDVGVDSGAYEPLTRKKTTEEIKQQSQPPAQNPQQDEVMDGPTDGSDRGDIIQY